MNAFVVSLVGSLASGAIAAMNVTRYSKGSIFSQICFVVVGALVGAAIYGSAGWIAIKLLPSDTAPRVSVRNTASGLAGLALVFSSPFVTWFAATAIVAVLVQSLGG